MPVGRIHEIYRKLNTNDIYKWSGIGQENAFLLATNLGTGKSIDFYYFILYLRLAVTPNRP